MKTPEDPARTSVPFDCTEEALEIAGFIAAQCFYPRFADAVALAIRYAALDGCPLDDDQATQLYRASFEAGDGIARAIAHEVDAYAVRQIERRGLS